MTALRRSRTGAVLGGVCAGVARSAGLDPLLLRIAVVAVTVLTAGAGLVAYLAAWVLIRRDRAAQAPAEPAQAPAGSIPPPRTPDDRAERTAASAVSAPTARADGLGRRIRRAPG